jgi:hypothetical protein
MKKLGAAGLALAGLLVTANGASAQLLCAIPLMISAGITSANEHRELTAKEAFWCGLVHETPAERTGPKKRKHIARAMKKKEQ